MLFVTAGHINVRPFVSLLSFNSTQILIYYLQSKFTNFCAHSWAENRMNSFHISTNFTLHFISIEWSYAFDGGACTQRSRMQNMFNSIRILLPELFVLRLCVCVKALVFIARSIFLSILFIPLFRVFEHVNTNTCTANARTALQRHVNKEQSFLCRKCIALNHTPAQRQHKARERVS